MVNLSAFDLYIKSIGCCNKGDSIPFIITHQTLKIGNMESIEKNQSATLNRNKVQT